MGKTKKKKPLSLPPESPSLILKGSSRKKINFNTSATNFNQAGRDMIISGDVQSINIVTGVVIIICQKCQYENSRNSKSCIKCGTSLIFVCPICKNETHLGAKFCSGCGKEISLIITEVKKDEENK